MKKSGSLSDGESKKLKGTPEGHEHDHDHPHHRRASLSNDERKEMNVKNVKINVDVVQPNAGQVEPVSKHQQRPPSRKPGEIGRQNDEETTSQAQPSPHTDTAKKDVADVAEYQGPTNVNAEGQEPKDPPRTPSHMEGDDYKSKRASDFMPALPIPGVKFPVQDAQARRRSLSESRTTSDTDLVKANETAGRGQQKPTQSPRSREVEPHSGRSTASTPTRRGRSVVKSPGRLGESRGIAGDKFQAKTYGPQDTNKESVKVNISVAERIFGAGQTSGEPNRRSGPSRHALKTSNQSPEESSRDAVEAGKRDVFRTKDQQQPRHETKEKHARNPSEKEAIASQEIRNSGQEATQRYVESSTPTQVDKLNNGTAEEKPQTTEEMQPSSVSKSSGESANHPDGTYRRVINDSSKPSAIFDVRPNVQAKTRGPRRIGKGGMKAEIIIAQPKRISDEKAKETSKKTAEPGIPPVPAQQPQPKQEGVAPQSQQIKPTQPEKISQASRSQTPTTPAPALSGAPQQQVGPASPKPQPSKIQYIAPPKPKTERARHPRRVLITPQRLPATEHEGPNFHTTTYGPFDTTKNRIKAEITVVKPKQVKAPPPPPPPEEVPEPPPEEPEEKRRSNDIPSPELMEDTNTDAMNILKKFGIPDQGKALESLLDKETVHFDFGGLMRQYYSYVLRSYCLINMQDRYRGSSKFSDCFTSIDISRVGTREEEMQKNTKMKLRRLDDKREKLRKVAVDDDHFNYLKNLANNQACLLPLTVVQLMNEQMAPVLEDIFRFYGKNLGTEHKCTKVAGFHYVKIRKRVAMYNYICGGSTINEDLTSFYK